MSLLPGVRVLMLTAVLLAGCGSATYKADVTVERLSKEADGTMKKRSETGMTGAVAGEPVMNDNVCSVHIESVLPEGVEIKVAFRDGMTTQRFVAPGAPQEVSQADGKVAVRVKVSNVR